MDKGEHFSTALPGTFPGLCYTLDDHHHHQHLTTPLIGETFGENSHQMVDFMLDNPQHQHVSSGFCSIADVMQFTDFDPKSALNQTKHAEEESGILKFPVLNDKLQEDESLVVAQTVGYNEGRFKGKSLDGKARVVEEEGEREDDGEAWGSENTPVQLQFLGENLQKGPVKEAKNKRKRPRTIKTSEEVESQRMTHIAVERNRRKQMNEHLQVLRSLMPSSYVQRGDQASIIGGAIEFVRELEQLLQCLESQKCRRLYGDTPRPMGDPSLPIQQLQSPIFPSMPLPNDHHQLKLVDYEPGLLREETAESKSCLADVEVKLLGFDAMIKIMSRRRLGQLIKIIAALQDLQLDVLHTNITTIEQTVLYSFNIKCRFLVKRDTQLKI
ncbi:transcription factor FAMA-like isoform X2 [Cornus florida]|uniref:transcription factor FAMA-like isoform X2 n=1 Tax=Cornus florida TaxID=4283 RepID=UPI0028A0E8BE|nr:transcription factor FAMA-like isoform X2 [Cornus florida]